MDDEKGRTLVRMGEEKEFRILVGRPRRRWEDNIKIFLGKGGWICGLNSIGFSRMTQLHGVN
jgi:hypothetical protein